MTTLTIGPSQPSGFRTIADLNAKTLAPGDVVQLESIDQSGAFETSTRLLPKTGVTYRSLDLGHKWGVLGAGGIDLAGVAGVTVEDYLGDGANLAGVVGVATTTASASTGFTMRRYELRNYQSGAMKSTHGQWADVVAAVTPGTGPDDSGWVIEDGYHHDNAPAGGGQNDWFHFGKSLTVRRVGFRSTGAGDHAFYPKGRGLRMEDVLFDSCVAPLSLRCGDQLCYRLYFDGCINPVTYFPYDKTGLGGVLGIYGAVFRGCSAPGGALIFLDDDNGEAGGLFQAADIDFELASISFLDSTTGAQGIDFRDVTTVRARSVLIRDVAHGKNVTAPYRLTPDWTKVDSDYNSYPNGGKPASPDDTHSITTTGTLLSEATLLPAAGSVLLGVGAPSVSARYTPPRADIGFQGYPAPAGASVVDERVAPTLAGQGSSATPGGSFTPPAALAVGDVVVYALHFNQNNLGDLVVTPPAGFTLRVSRSITDRDAVYVATRKLDGTDTLSGLITLPTWRIQDSVPADQARNYATFVAAGRNVDPTTPIPTGGTSTGGNSTAQATGNSGATAIASPPAGAWLLAFVAGKPGQTPNTHTLDAANSIPTTGWTKGNAGADVLQGTANGAASISSSAYSQVLGSGVASQAKIDVDFTVNAQWVAVALELAPAGGGSSDVTPPDKPARLRVERVASTSLVVTADPTDYGVVEPPTTGGGFADVGSPRDWYKLTQDGGLRPSYDSFDPSAILGPRAATYYSNAALRAADRGAPITGAGVRYYPRSLGLIISAIDYSDPAHFKVTLAAPPPATGPGAIVNGTQVQVRDVVGTNALPLKPKKPNGLYTVQSISGSILTFTTGANTTSGAYNPDSGWVIPESLGRSETIYSIDVTQSTIGSANDSNGLLFLPADAALPTSTRGTPANPWVLQPGRCNYLSVRGDLSAKDNAGKGSLAIRIPPWFDVYNASPDYLLNGANSDFQLANPFCHVELANCHLDVQALGAKGLAGGKPGTTVGYSEPLGRQNLVIPVGEAFGFGGCSGVISQVMSHDFGYDGNKGGAGAANLRWEYCSFFRNHNLVVSGGGHTDGFQLWDLNNTGIGAFVDLDGRVWPLAPTWYRCLTTSGGNAELFLNWGGGSGAGAITDTWALECIFSTGNKALLAAGCTNAGARSCLFDGMPEDLTGTPPKYGQKPTPLDFGSNDGDPPCSQTKTGGGNWHPCPDGDLIWPDPSTAPDLANLSVLADGSTTPISRPIPTGANACTVGVCFDYVD